MSSRAKDRCLYGRLGKIMLLALGFSFMLSGGASAGLFIHFDGITGESTNIDHAGWSNILDVHWGVSATAPTGGGGAGKTVFDDLSWTQVVDKSVTALFTDIVLGKYIKDATVDFTTTGSQPYTYFQMAFQNVFLTKLTEDGKPSSATMSGAFAYDIISMTYTYQTATGQLVPTTASYNLNTGAGSVGALAALFGLGTSGPNAVVPVPIPDSLFLLGSGLVGLIGLGRKFHQ